jgi:hypothetical protein
MEYRRELDRERISKLATHVGYRMDWSRQSELPRQGEKTTGPILS